MCEDDPRLPADALTRFGTQVLSRIGCTDAIAAEIAAHLVEADLCGVYSHGVFRLVQYADDASNGVFVPGAEPVLTTAAGGGALVDGCNGLGMPAMRLAIDTAIVQAKANGLAAVGVANVAHTGRIGEFAARAAEAGCLAILLGGGARKEWRQVAPYGGARGILPTNPYALAIPGGECGPVMIDFSTAAAAGGKVYAARAAGRPLPEGVCVDAAGRPTVDPEDYFNGGALLPMAGPKGYGMALIAELLGEAILGEAMSGMNWICVCIDLSRFRPPSAYRLAAEECLAELRACPPAPGFSRVEVPGEREAELRSERLRIGIAVPPATLLSLRALAGELDLDAASLNPITG